jgi:hypothetical protein
MTTKKDSIKESDSFLADLMKTWIDVLIKCEKNNGKTFIARLKGIQGNKLFFENKNGLIIMDSIDSILTASPMIYQTKDGEVVDRFGVV